MPAVGSVEVGDDLYSGEAYTLNRESEGTGASATATVAAPVLSPNEVAMEAPQPPAPKERWTRAIRLTREAVDAWANLLHGPAIVTIER